MKRNLGTILLVLTILVVGCGGQATMEPAMEPMLPESEESLMARSETSGDSGADWAGDAQPPGGEAGAEAMPRMIIYNGELQLVVKDTVTTQESITSLAASLEGYVSNVNSYAYGEGLQRINLTLRVPAENFDAAMADLRAMAIEVTQESISSQDVTQEYVDLSSRLRALEAKAVRLEELMEEAEDTEAVLAVYEELSATQQEIEQTKGRMQYLERSSAMATITITLTPDELSQPVEIAGWRPQGTVKQAIQALVNAFQFLIDALIWIVLLIVPVVAFIGLVLFALVKGLGLIFGRRRRERQARAQSGDDDAAEE